MKNVPRRYIYIIAAVTLAALAFLIGLTAGGIAERGTGESETVVVTRIVEKPLAAQPNQELVEVQVTRLIEIQVEVPVGVTRIVKEQVEIPVEVTRLVRQQVEVPVEVTRIVAEHVEVIVEEVEVTRIVEVQQVLSPMPHDVFIELTGSGTLVTENYQWGACNKVVFYGAVSAPQGNFIVHLWDANCTGDEIECRHDIFNMAPYDGEVQAESLLKIPAGAYYLEFSSVPSAPTTWTLIGECQS
jgi:hypothetical protein